MESEITESENTDLNPLKEESSIELIDLSSSMKEEENQIYFNVGSNATKMRRERRDDQRPIKRKTYGKERIRSRAYKRRIRLFHKDGFARLVSPVREEDMDSLESQLKGMGVHTKVEKRKKLLEKLREARNEKRAPNSEMEMRKRLLDYRDQSIAAFGNLDGIELEFD